MRPITIKRKLIRIGNSFGIIVPSIILKTLDIDVKEDDTIICTFDKEKMSIFKRSD